MSKAASIISKLVLDQYQPIIEDKTPQETWITLQKRFQHINSISTSWIIYNVTTKKFSVFKKVHKYTSYYQASFDKVVNFLTGIFSYICKSTEMYF